MNNGRLTVQRITRCAVMAALLLAIKLALSSIMNFEMVTLLVILFARAYGKDIFYSIAVFNIVEGIYWGFGTWWVAYLYIWNIIAVLAMMLDKKIGNDPLMWAVYSGMCGLCFGALCAVAHIPVSPSVAWAYWLSGLSADVWHCICNFVLMLALFKPLSAALERTKIPNR